MILCSSSGVIAYDFLFNNLWDNAYYWRYVTIISIFLMIVYKRKVAFYENLNKKQEHDKNIIRKALLVFSEIDLKELVNELLNNDYYTENQIKKLKEFENYLKETENDFISENLKKSVKDIKPVITRSVEFFENNFIKGVEKGTYKFKKDSSSEEFEFHDKIFNISSELESKYLNFMLDIKKEFI